MAQRLARFGIFYVAACEWALGGLFVLYALFLPVGMFFSRVPNTRQSILLASATELVLVVLASSCFLTARAFGRGKRWGWFGSLFISVVVVAFSFWMIHDSMLPDPYRDSSEAGMLAIVMLLFAIPAFALLWLSTIRRYLNGSKN